MTAATALMGTSAGMIAYASYNKKLACLKCGNGSKMETVFLEVEPNPLVKERARLRFVRCTNDGSVIRYPLNVAKPKCPKCGNKNYEVFYQESAE